MISYKVTRDYKNIVIDDVKLLDVRASVEFEKGAFINSTNIPILSNEERHTIGICYKEKGNEEATKLGYKIVSGKNKEEKLHAWHEYLKENPSAIIYCFRGGARSSIAQKWIVDELGIDIIKLDGGYKGFRNFLIDSLEPYNINAKPIVLTGYTGSGKTILLNKLKNSIDLEGIANHRGSAFGHFITPQPTQINFENNLAYDIIKHNHKEYKYLVVEDEGKNIGKSFIPSNFYNFIHKGDVVFLEATLEERVDNILMDYVINSQKQYIEFFNSIELGINKWYENIESCMMKLKNKLGGDRFKVVIDELKRAYIMQGFSNNYEYHKVWIELFLVNYYDPMYKHSIEKDKRNIIFSGDKKAVFEFLNFM